MTSDSNKVSIESNYNVYDDTEGASISVGSDQDGLGLIRISTDDEKSQEWWGKIDFTMSPEIAEGVAKAILRKVRDMKEESK
jgi:hypothetical protein